MKDIDFFSRGQYLYLPTSKKPKVILAVDNKEVAKNAFKLYNPFSGKARFLKMVFSFLFININGIARKVYPIKERSKSKFIKYLETKLKTSIVASLYYATAKDKVVLQLQADNQVIGYIKFPLNKIGIKHLLNEHKAIQILSKRNIIESAILFDNYYGVPYLLLKDLNGEIKEVQKEDLELLLDKFKTKKKYRLKHHPRVLKMKKKLIKYGCDEYVQILNNVCNNSTHHYYLVNEHGDFAPWNIIQSKNELIPFDFEYFKKQGLENMDLIKYYFQVGYLLEENGLKKLIDLISTKIPIPEIKLLIQVFLIKEILHKKRENDSYSFEKEMLTLICNEKA